MANDAPSTVGATKAVVRVVRCPRCFKLLPELAGYTVYRCGNCNTILQAKKPITTSATQPAVKSGDGEVSKQVATPSMNKETSSDATPLVGTENERENSTDSDNLCIKEEAGVSNGSVSPNAKPDEHSRDFSKEETERCSHPSKERCVDCENALVSNCSSSTSESSEVYPKKNVKQGGTYGEQNDQKKDNLLENQIIREQNEKNGDVLECRATPTATSVKANDENTGVSGMVEMSLSEKEIPSNTTPMLDKVHDEVQSRDYNELFIEKPIVLNHNLSSETRSNVGINEDEESEAKTREGQICSDRVLVSSCNLSVDKMSITSNRHEEEEKTESGQNDLQMAKHRGENEGTQGTVMSTSSSVTVLLEKSGNKNVPLDRASEQVDLPSSKVEIAFIDKESDQGKLEDSNELLLQQANVSKGTVVSTDGPSESTSGEYNRCLSKKQDYSSKENPSDSDKALTDACCLAVNEVPTTYLDEMVGSGTNDQPNMPLMYGNGDDAPEISVTKSVQKSDKGTVTISDQVGISYSNKETPSVGTQPLDKEKDGGGLYIETADVCNASLASECTEDHSESSTRKLNIQIEERLTDLDKNLIEDSNLSASNLSKANSDGGKNISEGVDEGYPSGSHSMPKPSSKVNLNREQQFQSDTSELLEKFGTSGDQIGQTYRTIENQNTNFLKPRSKNSSCDSSSQPHVFNNRFHEGEGSSLSGQSPALNERDGVTRYGEPFRSWPLWCSYNPPHEQVNLNHDKTNAENVVYRQIGPRNQHLRLSSQGYTTGFRSPYNASSHDFYSEGDPDDLGSGIYRPKGDCSSVISENLMYSRKAVAKKIYRGECRPLVGGAPFVACKKCFTVLQVPYMPIGSDDDKVKVRCGSCSKMIRFVISGKPMHGSSPESRIHAFSDGKNHVASVEGSTDIHAEAMDSHSSKENLEKERFLNSSESENMEASPPSTSSFSDDEIPRAATYTKVVLSSSEHPEDDPHVHFQHPVSKRAENALGIGTDELKEKEKVFPGNNNMKQEFITEESSNHISRKEKEQNVRKGDSFFAGLFKKSYKEISRPGQSPRKGKRMVTVNGYDIPENLVKKAEMKVGAIQSGEYWYDFLAGFWGAMGQPCLGIIPPFIEEFNYPMSEDCSGGNTGVIVNGRELHPKDFNMLVRRGLPAAYGRSYVIEMSGRLIDAKSGEELDGLGHLAPTIEKLKQGFGMRVLKSPAA